MRRRSSRRPRPSPPSLTNAWISLGFLVLMLVMIILMKDRVADSAAGCFTRISEEEQEERIVVPRSDVTEQSGNVRIVVPDIVTTSQDDATDRE